MRPPGTGHRTASLVGLTLAAVASLTSCGDGGPTRYEWSGLVWGRTTDDGAKACFGPGRPSWPPGECTGWPLAGFDWSTAPGVRDFSKPGQTGAPIADIRTAAVTIVGHIEGGTFVLDEAPGPSQSFPGPNCSDLERSAGPQMSMTEAVEVVGLGQRSGDLLSDGAPPDPIRLGAADFAAPDPLHVNLLINDRRARAWLTEHIAGTRMVVCGVLRET